MKQSIECYNDAYNSSLSSEADDFFFVPVSFFDEIGDHELDDYDLRMEAQKVEKFQFPVYEKPGHKDDMVRQYLLPT